MTDAFYENLKPLIHQVLNLANVMEHPPIIQYFQIWDDSCSNYLHREDLELEFYSDILLSFYNFIS